MKVIGAFIASFLPAPRDDRRNILIKLEIRPGCFRQGRFHRATVCRTLQKKYGCFVELRAQFVVKTTMRYEYASFASFINA